MSKRCNISEERGEKIKSVLMPILLKCHVFMKEKPVGNQFPETKFPFPCSGSHTRLLCPEDVKRRSNANTNKDHYYYCPRKELVIMEKEGEQQQRQKNPYSSSLTSTLPQFQVGASSSSSSQDEDNYCLLQKVSCLCLGEEGDCPSQLNSGGSGVCFRGAIAREGSDVSDDVSEKRSSMVIMSHHHPQYQQQSDEPNINSDSFHENDYVNVNFHRRVEYDTDRCVSTSISSSSSVSPVQCGGSSNNGDSGGERLSTFNRLCSETRRMIKEYHVKFEELPGILARFESDLPSLRLGLEKLKSFRSEAEDNLGELLERCKLNMETILRYSEIVLPSSDERRMTKEIYDLEQSVSALDQDICAEIDALQHFTIIYENLQECLQERLSRFTVIKTRLVQVERNLVKDESGLSLRLKGYQSILSVLEKDHKGGNHHHEEESTSNCSNINNLLSQIRPYNYIVDISKVLSQSRDLIQAEKQLLEEVKAKRSLLLEVKDSYSKFLRRLDNFQTWYEDYMKRLNETRVTGPDFDVLYPSLVTEREEKRKEFIEILASARNLRASIFDSSAVDKKIEDLQDQWKSLVEKFYRARSRKTV